MSEKNPTFGLSYLSPSSLATATIDVQNIDTSTPIHTGDDNAEEPTLDSFEIGEEFTPTNVRRRNNFRLQSILKNNANRSQVHAPNTSYYSTKSDSQRDPDSDLPTRQRVLFSPTKEVVSYFAETRKEFRVDVTKLNDDEDDPTDTKDNQPAKTQWWNDPSVPYVLLLYLQLLCNVLLVLMVVYVVYVMVFNIRADVRRKIEIYTSDAIQEISKCSRDYYRNKCSTDGNIRAPALEGVCTTWEKCMNRDPQQIGRSKITAETFAEIINGFFRPISWRSLFMSSFLLVASFFVTNFAFGSYRRGSAHNNINAAARIEALEKALRDQEKLSASRNYELPATPQSHFISNYEPILNDSMYSPVMNK